jgi:hypothetical protein
LWRLLVFPVLAFGLLYSRRLHRRLRERQRLLLAPPGTA